MIRLQIPFEHEKIMGEILLVSNISFDVYNRDILRATNRIEISTNEKVYLVGTEKALKKLTKMVIDNIPNVQKHLGIITSFDGSDCIIADKINWSELSNDKIYLIPNGYIRKKY